MWWNKKLEMKFKEIIKLSPHSHDLLKINNITFYKPADLQLKLLMDDRW